MIVLDDECILRSADQRGLIAALEIAFLDPAETPARIHNDLPGEDHAKLLLMPCWSGRDSIGVKIISVVPSNSERGRPTVDGVYVLMDGKTGEPLAVLSARTLTALRTAAVCALAASKLSRTDATELLMIGTGVLAPHLIKAYLAVRPLRRVVLWGRDSRKAEDLRQRLTDLPVEIEVAQQLQAVIGNADIISSATLSKEPLIEGDRVKPGAHVDLVGSYTPDMREADTQLFRRGRLVVDTATAFEESGDVIGPLREGVIDRETANLTTLLKTPFVGRRSPDDITIFKTVGTGLADLAAARYIHSKQ